MVFYISGPKLLFETTEISTHPNSTQQASNYIYLYTTKFGTSIKIRLNRKFESTEFETTRVNCIYIGDLLQFASICINQSTSLQIIYSTLQVYQRSYTQVRHIPPKMCDKFESQHSLSPTIWSDILVLVGHFGRT